MKDLTHQFLDFCRSKPRDELYDYVEPSECAFAQFALDHGIPNHSRKSSELPAGIDDLVRGRPRTFGALADRLSGALRQERTP